MLHRVILAGLSTCVLSLTFSFSQSAHAQKVFPDRPLSFDLKRALEDKTSCWISGGAPVTGRNLRTNTNDPFFTITAVDHNRGEVQEISVLGEDGGVGRYKRIPCPPPNRASSRVLPTGSGTSVTSGTDFGALRIGGSIGVRSTGGDLTNLGLATFSLLDPRPNPTTSLNSTSLYGKMSVTGGFELPQDWYIGYEGFWGDANNSRTNSEIPGTGGIAPNPAVRANDSTTVKETWNAGLLGKFGKELHIGNAPVLFNVVGGIGWQKVSIDLNCTAAGACGTNGITPVTLSTSKVRTGFLVGGEAQAPLSAFFSGPLPGNPILTLQYLHGDYGNLNETLGNPAQIQINVSKRVTTDTATLGVAWQPPWFSDIRLKRDIVPVTRLPNGIGLYRYRYLWSEETYVGVMAQEVAAVVPDAVIRGPDGFLRVDYDRLGLKLQTWDNWNAFNKQDAPIVSARQ